MYAVIKTGGKQYRITPGEEIRIEKLPGNVGEKITFDEVLLTSDGDDINVGKPYLENAKVVARITGHGKGRKVVVFKYKKRKGYRKKRGHRLHYSLVKVEHIET